MNSRPLRCAALSLCLALLGATAQAVPLDFCRTFGPSPGPGIPYQCVAALAFTGDPADQRIVFAPDRTSLGAVTAARIATGGGPYGAFASATASASPGLLRARSHGIALAPPVDGRYLAAGTGMADASFVDYGSIIGGPGAKAGDPVNVHLRFDMAGAFFGDGESFLRIQVYQNFSVSVLNTHLFTNPLQPGEVVESDFGFAVGDSIQMFVHLETQATGLSGRESLADVGNTAHAYLDVLSGNAHFESTSGHLYGLHDLNPPPVPEPSSLALLASGLGLLLGWTHRRAVQVAALRCES